MDFRTSRRREAAAGACALPPPHPRKDTIMESITTQGVAIPRLGFGTFRMPGGDAQPVVESAIALGYRHIDTAAMYENEAAVGAAITASGVNRNELFVTTKVWHDQLAPDALCRACDASLGKLRFDHVDLYMIHWPSIDMDMAATLEALMSLRERGVTKRPRLTPPLLGRSIAWLADRRRDPTPINRPNPRCGAIRRGNLENQQTSAAAPTRN
jgi:hypothetical protein